VLNKKYGSETVAKVNDRLSGTNPLSPSPLSSLTIKALKTSQPPDKGGSSDKTLVNPIPEKYNPFHNGIGRFVWTNSTQCRCSSG
jgi:hypothetical protein